MHGKVYVNGKLVPKGKLPKCPLPPLPPLPGTGKGVGGVVATGPGTGAATGLRPASAAAPATALAG